MQPTHDVCGIGNAIVDVLTFCDDAELAKLGLTKGAMTLIDETQAEALYAKMGQSTECSGGSVANSLAGLASLGAQCSFTGKVKDDQLGAIFRHDMRAVGVAFDTPAANTGPATARCLIFVTPDAQRTMATYLGACTEVTESDVDAAAIAAAKLLYIEGYLWDQPSAKAAIRSAMAFARQAGRKVALTLSDTFCVERHRDEFNALIDGEVDILFANEDEAKALTQTTGFDAAVKAMHGRCEMVAITRGAQGSAILWGDNRQDVAAQSIPNPTDTTGAGDLFASGFLYGYTRGWEPGACAQLGNHCAGQIIQQLGARSQKPLKPLAEQITKAA